MMYLNEFGMKESARGGEAKCDMDRDRRRSIRLKGYDYSQVGAYFITICTRDRACFLGNVVDGQMYPNGVGQIAGQCWEEIPNHFPYARLDVFTVMPNHLHGIVVIAGRDVGARHAVPLPERFGKPISGSIPTIIRSFKSAATQRIHKRENTLGMSIWQRNYYEHVIRNEESLNRIRQYILDNPAQWTLDRENPVRTRYNAPQGEEPWRI